MTLSPEGRRTEMHDGASSFFRMYLRWAERKGIPPMFSMKLREKKRASSRQRFISGENAYGPGW